MRQYVDLIRHVITHGNCSEDRTGVGTIRSFGHKLHFDLRNGFPLVTVKYTWFKGIATELLWFISGDTNTKFLVDNDVHIWDAWATEDGDLGPIYGAQWAKQLDTVIDKIKNNPGSRRLIVDSWQIDYLPDESVPPQDNIKNGKMALAPCHMMYQFFVDGNYLDIQVYQRSADVFLGVPFNIASYALLLSMVARVTGKLPRYLHYVLGDTHIYSNHIDAARTVSKREPKYLPTLYLEDKKDIHEFTLDDLHLINYFHHEKVKVPIAV